MPYFQISGAEIYYEVLGEGRPFVFSHGLGGSLERVREFVVDLEGIQAILYDNRSHGRTRSVGDRSELTFARMASDVAALLDHLSVPAAIVGGVSMGAGVALSFALRHGARAQALVLSRPAWLDEPHPPNLAFAPILADLVERHGTEGAVPAFQQTSYYKEILAVVPGAAESLCTGLRDAGPEALIAAYRAIPGSTPVDSMRQLSGLRLPALVIGTPNDPMHPLSIAEAWAGALPDCRLQLLPSRYEDAAGHLRQFREVVTDFLRSIG